MQINQAHLHLMLNHIPVLGSVFALLLLGGGFSFRSRSLFSAGLATLLAVGIFTVPVYLSGEPAEHMVEHQPNVSEPAIHEHEEMADIARIAGLAGGILAIIALVAGRGREQYPGWSTGLALLVSLAACVLFALTANLGGKISHPEIRGDGLLPVSSGAAPAMQGERRGHDDDDDD